MLNAITIAAIVAAVWAHPLGVSYLDKIDQIELLANNCGNPCCQQGGGASPPSTIPGMRFGKRALQGREAAQFQEASVKAPYTDDDEILLLITQMLGAIL